MGRFRESETCKAQVSQPSRSSLICSMHFKPDDFVRRLDFLEEEGILLTPWLNQDEFGFLSIHAAVAGSNLRNSSQRSRDRRQDFL